MACCSETTLVAPDGTPVLVVRDGAGNLAYTDLNTGAAYGGDVSLLTVPLQTLRDCNGNVIDVGASNFLTWDQLTTYNRGHHVPFVDSGDGCTPAVIADCPSGLTAVTTNPMGDVWAWDGAAWSLQTISAGRRVVPLLTAGTTTLNDADLAQWSVDNGTAFAELDCISASVTNDDCVPWNYRIDYRLQAQWTAVGPSNQWRMEIANGAGDTSPTTYYGFPASIIDTFGQTNANMDLQDTLVGWGTGTLAPGASADFEVCSRLSVVTYTADVNQLAQSVALQSTVTIDRGAAI